MELAEFVKTEPQLGYEALTDVSSIDRLKLPIGPDDAAFHTVYQLRSYGRKQHLTIVCPAEGGDDPVVPSLSAYFRGGRLSRTRSL